MHKLVADDCERYHVVVLVFFIIDFMELFISVRIYN